ncbi:hypothetical protein BHM03_00020491 [Ensete ventricosum]|nr:hypothetical protein BHM03_00020491 [Ensete ventricosum]
MTALQAFLLFRPLPGAPPLSRRPERLCPTALRRPVGFLIPSHLHKSRSRRRLNLALAPRALPSENSDSFLEPSSPDKDSSLDAQGLLNSQLSRDSAGEGLRGELDAASIVGDAGNGAAFVEEESVEKTGTESRLPLMLFLMGVLTSARKSLNALLMSEWLSWWPFWRKEQRLERLIADADANPKDSAKESALLAELNKHRVLGAAALQKYVGSLGGIGTSGVGSSATYAPKELNKEIMPEKVI